jgi:hypothetical protein
VYKPWRFHSGVDSISWLLNATENLGVLDKTIDASLFLLQLEWLQEMHTCIFTKKIPKGYSMEQRKKSNVEGVAF